MIAAMAEVVGALCRGDSRGDATECSPQCLARSMSFVAQFGFHLREDHLDWVEVGAVRRQESQLSTRGFDGPANSWDFVDRKVVHYDDVIGLQRGDQHLLDIGCEQLGIDGSVEHLRSEHTVFAQAPDKA